MIFLYKKWDQFCADLISCGLHSIPAYSVEEEQSKYVVLKHDVETNVSKAYKMALIEKKYGHKGSYYVQANLLEDVRNVHLLKEMEQMGHEISYHYDVLDACSGDLEKAIEQFDNNLKLFKKNGFVVKTVCQHGNPVMDRRGYTSNRDFFRSTKVQELYPSIADIMVDFQMKARTEYLYFSDAGRKFNMIYDPINNDRINSDEKNIPYKNLDELIKCIANSKKACVISTHPHRWENTGIVYLLKEKIHMLIKRIAKALLHIPLMKKIMSKYYYLAKKI